MDRKVLLVASLLWTTGCGLVLDAAPPRSDAAVAGIDASVPPVDASRDDAPDGLDGTPLDAARPDTPLPDASMLDAAPEPPCLRAIDGTECAADPRRICVSGLCVPSACGDGVIDTPAGEECEPFATDPACDPVTCRYECFGDPDCLSPATCLIARCMAHVCTYPPRMGTCITDMGLTSMCREGACPDPDCGNGLVEPGEDCDPGLGPAPGCRACRFECESASDCQDGDGCNGAERCTDVVSGADVLVGRVCEPGLAAMLCDPRACYTGGCVTDPSGEPSCEYALVDSDGDGFAVGDECGGVGGDCDDANPDVHPGAVEVCNASDDDCDGVTDEDTAMVDWCPDADGDSFGDPAGGVRACALPGPGFVRDCSDCFDTASAAERAVAALVHPGQPSYFSTRYCTLGGDCSFDYDCSGADDVEFPDNVVCAGLVRFECDRRSGWMERVPECGVTGDFATCRGVTTLGFFCRADTTRQPQRCR